MKWAVYNVLFALVYPFLLPGFLLRMLKRGGYAARMGDRFALYPRDVGEQLRRSNFVWIHAVSVGEVQVAGQLMREWRKADPSVRFCFSTTSSTGWKIAEKTISSGDRDVLIYNPLDFPNFVKSALKTVRPKAIVMTESEIWPNFILKAKQYGIPLFLINARVSDRSAPRYRLAKFFFGDVFGSFTRIFAQSELDASRIRAVLKPGVDNVEVTGSFKFDVAHRNPEKERELREWIGLSAAGAPPRRFKILLGGSTWPGEDQILIDIYKKLQAGKSPSPAEPLLVIAPRHFEKADDIEANIKAAGFECVRRSRGDRPTLNPQPSTHTPQLVFLADTTGELMGLYGIADVVFVGKSLCEHGSQNMIEPCLCGKQVFVGPYTENFRPVMSDLLEGKALTQVASAEELERGILAAFAASDAEAAAIGERATAAVMRRCGVVSKCVSCLTSYVLTLALAAMLFIGCSRKEAQYDSYVYAPVTNVFRYIEMVENASAGTNRVTLIDLDVRGLDASAFKEKLLAAPGAAVHVWMPGRTRWLIVSRPTTNAVSLAAAMESLAVDAASPSLPQIFANYAGTREDIMPAFRSKLVGDVVPEWFVTRDIPDIKWLKAGKDVDDDIRDATLTEIRSMQLVRREVLEGDMLAAAAKSKTDEEKATDKWHSAALRNPKDLLLCERLDRLSRNAVGFLKLNKVLQAMKCYETMVLVKPTAASVHNFGMCLKKIGKTDLAERALKHAKNLEMNLER